MGSDQTHVCVKQVKQELSDEWNETMPLPGDIIEGYAEDDADAAYDSFVHIKSKSEFSTRLGKINPQVEFIWLKIRRGEKILKIQARVVMQKSSMLQKKYTIQAANDDRHVVDLGDMTLEQCTELQDLSRRVVNVDFRGFRRIGIKYDWKMKQEAHLLDQNCPVISSILFNPLESEHCINATTARCMAWFSAAISSGVPLVFVNIQTEQIVSMEKTNNNLLKGESGKGKQQINDINQIMCGIRLWFLPGLAEVPIELVPQSSGKRLGLEFKRTEEGFMCIYSVITGSAADRAGIRGLYEEALERGFLLVVSRLEGKSLLPTSVCNAGLINCCDHFEIKDTLTSAIHQNETILLHFMAWPNNSQTHHCPISSLQAIAFSALMPPQ